MLLRISQLVLNYMVFEETIFSARRYDLDVEVEDSVWQTVVKDSMSKAVDAEILFPCLKGRNFDIFNIQKRKAEDLYIVHLIYDFKPYEEARNLDGIELMFYKLADEGWNIYMSMNLEEKKAKILELLEESESFEGIDESDEDEDDDDSDSPVENKVDEDSDPDEEELPAPGNRNQIKLD